MRVAITGAGGQLGRDLVAAFETDDVLAFDSAAVDVGDRDAVLQAITTAQPDAVVHTATYTDVDGCERDPDRAFRVNALGTRHVAEAARLAGAYLCVVSTDYVFDGASPDPYHEWDETGPLSVYGRSKLAGEREALAAAPAAGASIVRTSLLAGFHGNNFVKTILRLAAERDELTVVADQRSCPTFTGDLAAMIRRFAVARLPGVFHVTNQGPSTRFDFARDILTAAGLDAGKVRPISTAELDPPSAAPRPANSVLDNAALRLAGIPLLPDHHEPLERLVKELST